MTDRRCLGCIAATLGVILAVDALAAGRFTGGGCGGWGAKSFYDRTYDPDKVVELEGNVGAVERYAPRPGMAVGVCFELVLDEESYPVHLGPSYFLDNREFHIRPGDHVQLRASMVRFEDGVVLMAAEITRGEEHLVLRDETGYPAWSRQANPRSARSSSSQPR